ncbi:mitochondrial protein import protein MAS5 [[Candida] railenensis]|uniref:Mitochondrial protein import protein MAS5 n=1 Tax=[Candida] railenensis TaxID=45579 RepID=A0A9P0QKF9_9ASCO|nr:mitochondrial protein import protein MAS5 [[Candida] railenensis]
MSDLYEILEVDSSATSVEIKRAYRKLALRYHPDKVTEEERETAELKFKEISQAYEILIEEDKRKEYDIYGTTDGRGGRPEYEEFNGNPFDNFYGGGAQNFEQEDFYNFFNGMNGGPPGGAPRSAQRKPRTDDAELDVTVTLEDLFKGKIIKSTSTRNIICTTCKGSGAKKNAVMKTCGICEGSGTVRKIRRVGPGLVTQDYVECSTCHGVGKIYRSKDTCKKCTGKRVIEETKILEFEIPKGSEGGEKVVLKGESDEYPGKETGDIVLKFECEPHKVFTRKGDDLYIKYKISLVEALSGFSKVVLKHLDGRGIKISTPTGKVIRPGDFIKIKYEGMPVKKDSSKSSWFGGNSADKRGDLYIEMDIEFPKDNWYLEKNDITKIKNLLPNELQSKRDIEKQTIDKGSLPEANIEVFSDFTIARANALPEYTEKKKEEQGHHFYEGDEYSSYGRAGPGAQPECAQQ